MKRILSVILTLCLLCAVPFTHAEVDYSSDYETALTLALNDLTNAKGLETAIDILQQLGGYQMSRNYQLYFEALVELTKKSPDLETAGMYIGIMQEAPAFVADLAERGFPSCEEIGQYIRARELEKQGDRAGAYDLYKVMTILDAPVRAVNLRKQINETASTVTVIYRTENGAELDRSTESIPKGSARTITAKEFSGYALTAGSQKSVRVTVDSLGRQSQKEVVFTYRKLPDTATVTVICRTDTGKQLSRETKDVKRGGSLTVNAKTFDGYVLTNDSQKSVRVTADSLGEPSQKEVVFIYRKLPDTAAVTVICQTDTGKQLSCETKDVKRGGSLTVYAKTFDGYELTSGTAKSITVSVDSMGNPSQTQVVFTYKAYPAFVDVKVICKDVNGTQLSAKAVRVDRGTSKTIKAESINGYELISTASYEVKVDSKGTVNLNQVVFTYKARPVYAEVKVICRDENGVQLSAKTVKINSGTSMTIKAESIDGYRLISMESYGVWVDSEGHADKTQVVFRYHRDKLQISVGDYVTFGHYPQTAAGNDSTPIEWLVLDVRDGKALLLSRYGLDAKPYSSTWYKNNWEECTLRIWLNETFYEKAFSVNEQSAILLTYVDNSKDQGSNNKWNSYGGIITKDKVFLLSCAEANRYLEVTGESYDNRKSVAAPTPYAAKQGAYYLIIDGSEIGWWWLRSPVGASFEAAMVYSSGALNKRSVDDSAGCVRPAIWINLDADII